MIIGNPGINGNRAIKALFLFFLKDDIDDTTAAEPQLSQLLED